MRGYGTQQTTGYSIEVNACYETVDTVVIRTTLQGPEKKEKIHKKKTYVDEIEWNYTGEKNRGTIVHENKKEHAGW